MADSTVPHFQEELEQLKARLLAMGGLAVLDLIRQTAAPADA